MKYSFTVYAMEVEGHRFWVAESKDLPGCIGQGDTIDEAVSELSENEDVWLDTAKEYKIPIPSVSFSAEVSYSGKFTVRMAKSVHKTAARLANEEGISLNQYVNDAIVEKNKGIIIAENVLSKVMQSFASTASALTESFTLTVSVLNDSFCTPQKYGVPYNPNANIYHKLRG